MRFSLRSLAATLLLLTLTAAAANATPSAADARTHSTAATVGGYAKPGWGRYRLQRKRSAKQAKRQQVRRGKPGWGRR